LVDQKPGGHKVLFRIQSFARWFFMYIQATQLREGVVIVYENALCRIFYVQHITPGNLRGLVQVKMKRLSDDRNLEHRFRSTDTVEKAVLQTRAMEYLYSDTAGNHFMDTENYEQVTIGTEDFPGMLQYLTPNTPVQIEFHQGNPVNVILPTTVNLKVVKTEPFLKGATASGGSKPATVETGLVVQVPPFIEEGQVLRIDTRTGTYVERASL
jgi:elongation factor P